MTTRLLTCAVVLTTTAALLAQDEAFVQNPSFEQVAEDGSLVAWPAKLPVTSVSDERARTGSRSLKWINHDPTHYVLVSQDVELKPGHRYAFEVWVNTENLHGGGTGATVCIEWGRDDGAFLGGSYPAGVKGTTDGWTKVEGITQRIPADAASCHITCYVRKGGVGTAYFDDVRIEEYIPPLVDVVVTDAYRNQVKDEPFKVLAGLNLLPERTDPASLSVSVVLRGAAGQTVAHPTAVVRHDDRVEATFDAANVPVGTYQAVCDVKTADGSRSGRAECTVRKVAHFPPRKAYIDRHGRLILDEEPFFPLGTYWSGVDTEMLDIYAESDFNCLMPYHMIGRDMLDAAQARDLQVIYSVKDLYQGRRGLETEEAAEKEIARRVAELKDHPAIAAWYINDEMPLSRLPELTAHRDLLEQLDPGRPTWVVLYQIGDVRAYLPTFDVIGTDPYPIPHKDISAALRYAEMTRDAVVGARAVWMVPQIFNWASYRKERDEKEAMRAPTLEEMRSMAWQCIAGGANGLVFYSWMDLWRMDKTVEQGGRALVREPFEERWSDVSQMASEIARFIPVLLSVGDPMALTRGEGDDGVAVRLYAHDGRTYVLAVNSTREEAGLTLLAEAEVAPPNVAFGSETVSVDGRRLEMRFAPLEVKLFALSSP